MRNKLIEYGYKWLGMIEVSYEYAILFCNDNAIYKLYEDNTESLVDEKESWQRRNDIKSHYENGGKFGIEINEFDNYIVFVLGRDYLKDILPYENDIAYEWCVNIAKDFEVSDFNVNSRSKLACLEDYIKANIYQDTDNTWCFGKATLEEVCSNTNMN